MTFNKVPSADARKKSALHYDEFFGPLYFEPYAMEVVKRIEPGHISVALEIASGTGRVTRHIRERIPAAAKLVASDISEEMLMIARQKINHQNIHWQIIDAQQLPFADNSIDLVICCFGYMFVPDKPKAFSEASRVLKPGGQFIFTTWDTLKHNGASYTYRSIAEQCLGKPFPEANEATSMSDENDILPLLQNAGFVKTKIEKSGLHFICPTAKEAAEGFLKADDHFDEIRKNKPELMNDIKTQVEKEFTEQFGDTPMIAPMSALIIEAWK